MTLTTKCMCMAQERWFLNSCCYMYIFVHTINSYNMRRGLYALSTFVGEVHRNTLFRKYHTWGNTEERDRTVECVMNISADPGNIPEISGRLYMLRNSLIECVILYYTPFFFIFYNSSSVKSYKIYILIGIGI